MAHGYTEIIQTLIVFAFQGKDHGGIVSTARNKDSYEVGW